ncbi:MAG: sensor histidine kinase, partial [Proteobacteria bacterium]|nr:sensor histidine kinase [Pseudomonadota bacterium]
KPRKTKIFHKFLRFVLPFLILAILITSIILSWTSYAYFRKTIAQDYENIIKSSAGEIRLFIKNAQKGLESLAWVMMATKLDPWQKKMALTAFNHQTAEFISVSLISVQGKTIASTSWEEIDVVTAQKELFERARTGKNVISGVMLTKETIPFMHMAVPVRRLGEVREVLWGELNLKYVWDILEGITIGRSGQVYIMDLSGRYIAHREIDRVVSVPPTEKPDFLKALTDSKLTMQWIEKKDNSRFFCMGTYVPDMDWMIVLRQPLPEIYIYLYRNIYWAILVTGLICLAAILLGWNRIQRFVTPIQTLHHQVQQIGRGDLEQKISVDTKDEIGDLALAFNEMTDALKELIRQEVETAKELAHAKNLAILGTTSSKVTHEVGNLLNNIGMALSAFKGETLSGRGEKALGILEKESARVREFIYNFLQFAKKPELRPTKISLDLIIKEVLAVHQSEADQRQITLDLDWPAELPRVDADARLMYQAVDNLVKNSLDAMTDSGSVRIEGRTRNNYLYVTVADTGSGIEPQNLNRIFDPFFTSKGKKGTGLGMSIVKTIVTAHRGTIECLSEPNRGTTIIVRLPLR